MVFNSPYAPKNLYDSNIEVDYRGPEVSVENFIRVLTGRHDASTPRNKRLQSDHQSNVLIFLTGHGSDGFIKFHESTELTSRELANSIASMFQHNRYHEVMVIADSCNSAAMYEFINSPGVISTSSSQTEEQSYAHDYDEKLGLFVIDRYTHFTLAFMDKNVKSLDSNTSLQEYLESCPFEKCLSEVGVKTSSYPKDPKRVRVTDFFGSSRIKRFISEDLQEDAEWTAEIAAFSSLEPPFESFTS